MNTEKRFWSKVMILENGCWQWMAGKNTKGYGEFFPDTSKPQWRAHIWAYVQYVGPIPEGLQLDHTCRNRACVNPLHLDPVTNQVNVLLGASPAAINARKTHCPYGHPLSGDNLMVWADEARRCRTCERLRNQARREVCHV